jgi:chemotaxis regulatin CheY-phosphate phosphatase CheZ
MGLAMASDKSTKQEPGSGQSDADQGMLGQFVKAIAGLLPALDNIKTSIEESSGKIPKASSQLQNVTMATESATVEILNVLDGMSQGIEKAEAGAKKLRTSLAAIPGVGPDLLADLDGINASLAQTRDSSMSIAMALQVQDITSQQIAGVTHMIESVRVELMGILNHFGAGAEALVPGVKTDPKHFDTDAQYNPTGERQEQADLIIQQWTSNSHE